MEGTVYPVTTQAYVPRAAAISVPAWGWVVLLAALFALYLITQDNGLVLGSAAEYMHALTHDARHAFGVPCH